MPINRSRAVTSRIILLASSVVLFVSLAWVGVRVFQPADIPPSLPPQTPVSFNADKSIEKNSLFEKLQIFVKGGYIVGEVGNSFPLGGDPKKKTIKGYDSKSLLATAKEVELRGLLVKDVVLQKENGVLVLLTNTTSDLQIHYEIRLIGSKEEKTLIEWNAPDRADLRVAGIAQDSSEQIWLVNEKGQVGMITKDGQISWLSNISTGLTAPDPKKILISIDALDRVWITDGVNVSMGGEKGFTPVNLTAELTQDQRLQYETILFTQAEQIGLRSTDTPGDLLKSALMPKEFFPLSDGRMGLTMAFGVMIFPQSQAARAEWIPTLQYSQIPYGISNGGTVWGLRNTDRTITRIQKGQEFPFATGPSPSVDTLKSSMMAFLGEGGFVFEQTEKLTNLWYSDNGDAWSTKLVSTTGTQSIVSPPARLKIESSGTIWSLMTDGHLYQITAGATVVSPTETINL